MEKNQWKVLWAAGAMACLLAGCGGSSEAAALPENYVFGQEMLPAMGEAQGVGAELGATCEVTTDGETGETTYAYSGLESGQEAAQAYLDALQGEYGCSVMDADGIRRSGAATEEEGELLVGKDMADGSGILSLRIQWSADTCQLTSSILDGMQLQDPPKAPEKIDPIGVTAAVEQLESMTPEELGVPADQTYTAYADDGYIMLNDEACYRLKLYGRSDVDTPEIMGTYLMSLDGKTVYRLEADQSVEELSQS